MDLVTNTLSILHWLYF